MKRGAAIFYIMLAIVLALPAAVTAFAISTPYIVDDTLSLRPGEEYNYIFTVQNGEDEGYNVIIEYNSTGNIARMQETGRFIQPKTYDNAFTMAIKIPRDAPQGQKYSISYSARPKVDKNGTVTMGVEIRRGLTIIVGGEQVVNPPATDSNPEDNIDIQKSAEKRRNEYIGLSALILISAVAILLIWKASKNIVSKLMPKEKEEPKKAEYTISQAMSLEDVKALLHKISDEEYEFPEIKNIFKQKLTELSSKRAAKEFDKMTRTELINAIDRFSKGK